MWDVEGDKTKKKAGLWKPWWDLYFIFQGIENYERDLKQRGNMF